MHFGTFVVGITALVQTFHCLQNYTGLASNNQALSFAREALLSPPHYGDRPTADLFKSLTKNLPEDIRTSRWQRLRKIGRRGGVQQLLQRRGNRPPLPSMILSNARLLSEMDEL